jgi:hypothetical protein
LGPKNCFTEAVYRDVNKLKIQRTKNYASLSLSLSLSLSPYNHSAHWRDESKPKKSIKCSAECSGHKKLYSRKIPTSYPLQFFLAVIHSDIRVPDLELAV